MISFCYFIMVYHPNLYHYLQLLFFRKGLNLYFSIKSSKKLMIKNFNSVRLQKYIHIFVA